MVQEGEEEEEAEETEAEQEEEEEEGVKVGGVTQTAVTPTEVDLATLPRARKRARGRASERGDSVDSAVLSYLERRNDSAPDDAVSKLFASISDSIRKLPLRTQSGLKFKIHALVHDAEADLFAKNTLDDDNIIVHYL